MRLAVEAIFQVRCETRFGAEVRVVGSSDSLGRWDPTRGFRLYTSAKLYPLWRSRSTCLVEQGVEYKYVVAIAGQEVRWERGHNRHSLAVTREDPDCQVVLLQHVFDAASERAVRLRPFPDRRAFSHLRRPGHSHTSLSGRPKSCGHEDPTGSKSLLEDLNIDLPNPTDSSSGISGITRASSTDSASWPQSDEDPGRQKQKTFLVWPQSVSPNSSICSIDVFGSFTRPAWTVPLTLHLCPETGIWWIAVEEALPQLQPGTYEFKFLLNDQVWMANPALPVSRNADGVENNKLRIDCRLLTCIERKAIKSVEEDSTLTVNSTNSTNSTESDRISSAKPGEEDAGLKALMEPGSRSSSSSFLSEGVQKKMNGGQPRRTVSTAERLHRTGSVHSSLYGPSKRTLSLPHLCGDREALDQMNLVGSPAGGTLYDSDVALLLELPDVKRRSGFTLVPGSFYKPKDGAGEGEDGHFAGHPALGVADGVGGLQHVLGYTSKAFADELMLKCQHVTRGSAEKDCGGDPGEIARNILCDGFMGVKKYGASTAAIAYLDTRSNRLGIAVLGDSGVMVIRRPTSKSRDREDPDRVTNTRSFIVFKSPSQQHDFNYPYQLCRLPQALRKLLIRRPDMPSDCLTFNVDVEEGDLLLVYSDGVDDNLHDQEVLEICDRALSPYAAHVLGLPTQAATPAELVSRAIGTAAYLRSGQENARTPFAEEARKAGWPLTWCRGGKEDDITCVAAWITHASGGGEMAQAPAKNCQL